MPRAFPLTNLDIETVNIEYSDLTNQLYAQTIFAQRFLLGAGLEHKYLHIESETLQNTEPVLENSSYFSLYGYLKFDSIDKNYFPKKGFHFYGDFKSLFYSTDYRNNFEPFSIAKADMEFVQTFWKRLSHCLQTEGGFAR